MIERLKAHIHNAIKKTKKLKNKAKLLKKVKRVQGYLFLRRSIMLIHNKIPSILFIYFYFIKALLQIYSSDPGTSLIQAWQK